MAGLVDFKWLYQLFVLLNVAVGIAGIWAVVNLVRGKQHAYRNAVIVLVVGLLVSGVHMATSEILRGASAPNNMRVYVNLFTLALFLFFRIPFIWRQIDWEGGRGSGAAAGLAMIVGGLMALTVQMWSGPTHTWGGINFADVWHTELLIVGSVFLFCGLLLLAWAIRPRVAAPISAGSYIKSLSPFSSAFLAG